LPSQGGRPRGSRGKHRVSRKLPGSSQRAERATVQRGLTGEGPQRHPTSGSPPPAKARLPVSCHFGQPTVRSHRASATFERRHFAWAERARARGLGLSQGGHWVEDAAERGTPWPAGWTDGSDHLTVDRGSVDRGGRFEGTGGFRAWPFSWAGFGRREPVWECRAGGSRRRAALHPASGCLARHGDWGPRRCGGCRRRRRG